MNIKEIINDNKRVFIGEEVPNQYQEYLFVSDVPKIYGVVLPKSKEEIINVVKYANDNNIVMIVRGASTSVAGAIVPVLGNELVIDLSLMNNILDFDEETMTLTVEPGVLLKDIKEYAESKGYFYPPDPGTKLATIGGNVSTNAGGMTAVKYGTTRNYVKALDVVLPNGEAMTVGGLNIKSSSGYDLKNLFIGSEGTLGVTTEIKLKIIAKPKFEKSMILAFDTVEEASKTVLSILSAGYDPSALELFERSTIEYSEKFLNKKFQSQKGNAYILMTLDGNDEQHLLRTLESLKNDACKKTLEVVTLETTEEAKIAWDLRDHILYALMEFTEYEMLDEVVPINKFADMIAYTKKLQEKHNIKVLNFGHAGDGNIHTVLMKGEYTLEQWAVKRKGFLDDLYNKVNELGGLPSAEHGIGIFKKEYFLKMTDKVKLDFMRSIKNTVDPKGLLNPNKIF